MLSKKNVLLSLLLMTSVVYSSTASSGPYHDYDYDKGFVPVDLIIMRPLGFVATLAGTALFIGLSPLTAFAQISPPHDAFKKTANLMIIAPALYTFDRPLGNKSLMYFPDP